MALGPKEAALWRMFRAGMLGLRAGILLDRIETHGTSGGIPDAHITDPEYGDCWIELKVARKYKIHLTPLQAAWLTKRATAGSRCRIVALNPANDVLHVWSGLDAASVAHHGIAWSPIYIIGKPYDWQDVRRALYYNGAR